MKRPTLTYQAYCQNKRWQEVVQENSIAGTIAQSLRLEALKFNVFNTNLKGTIQYRAHVSKDGWQNWKSSGEIAGTTGQSRAIEAIQIQLTSEMAAVFDIYYRIYSAQIGWLGWARNGAYAGTTGGGLRAEAVQVIMVNKGSDFSTGATAYRQYTSSVNNNSEVVARKQAEAVNWAKSQINKELDYDKMYGNQCVDLIKYYYDYFGVAEFADGNADKYATNNLPPGWVRVYENYQPGDVGVWVGCHVGIITSIDSVGFNAVNQRYNDTPHCTENWFKLNVLQCAIRPNFSAR